MWVEFQGRFGYGRFSGGYWLGLISIGIGNEIWGRSRVEVLIAIEMEIGEMNGSWHWQRFIFITTEIENGGGEAVEGEVFNVGDWLGVRFN